MAADKALRITVASVAKEAGHSRNALYTSHPDLVERIDGMSKAVEPKSAKSPMDEHRERIGVLEREKRDALTENMGLLVRLNAANSIRR